MARIDLFAKIPLIGMSLVFLAMFIVAVTAYLHVGWYSIIGYAIAAVTAGLEVTCRLGVAIKVDIVESGFIYTSLLGYFGATAAAGRSTFAKSTDPRMAAPLAKPNGRPGR
jgi:hypothetical protein